MKVVKKSLKNQRRTLTLNEASIELVERLRGGKPKSVFIAELVAAEAERRKKQSFYASAIAAYTPEVSRETLAINAQFPISEA
jgi:hypothetical protein